MLLDLPPLLAALALAAIAAHGIARYPRTPRLLVLHRDGTWAVPERGWHGLSLASGTTWTTWYVELVFRGPARARILVLKDQLDAENWRALQLAVREHEP
jgi:energy-converting hydrogenase Eha subunit G